MVEQSPPKWFDGIENIVTEPLKFKSKLAIGEDAYTSLRLKNATFELWDAAGVATTAATIAKSTAVAGKFFAPTGFLAFFGIGSAAVTPIGWVVVAGVIAGGGWIGITHYIKQSSSSRVTVIPNFINTPMDVLALGLFDLMAPLALKVAFIDGEVDASERDAINSYFIKQWGYDSDFVREGIAYTEKNLSNFSVKNLAQSLGEFQKQNPDCNFKAMSQEIVGFLREVMEADGRIDEREEMAIEKVQAVFVEIDSFNFKKIAKRGAGTVSSATKNGVGMVTGFFKKRSEANLPIKKD